MPYYPKQSTDLMWSLSNYPWHFSHKCNNNNLGKYYEQPYANKFNNLDKMGKFLERHRLPKLTQEEIYNLKSLSIKEIEFVV